MCYIFNVLMKKDPLYFFSVFLYFIVGKSNSIADVY